MTPWTRDNTKTWIAQLENRLEDIAYYLKETEIWCEDHCVYDDQKVFMCNLLTCVWVSHMRNETISYRELLEILGVEKLMDDEDKIYALGPNFCNLDHEEMLELIVNKFDDY